MTAKKNAPRQKALAPGQLWPKCAGDVMRVLSDAELAEFTRYVAADQHVADLNIRILTAEGVLFNARTDYRLAADNAAMRWWQEKGR